MQEMQVQSSGQEDTLEKGMTIHSSTLAWKTPGCRLHGVAKNQTWLKRLRRNYKIRLPPERQALVYIYFGHTRQYVRF